VSAAVANVAINLARSGSPVGAGMRKLLKICAEIHPSKKWPAFDAINFESDTPRLKEWLLNLLKDEPPPGSINGFWFGMFNPVRGGEATADLYLAGSDHFNADDANWACRPAYWPNGRNSNSNVLREIYRLSYGKSGGLQNDAEYPLSLGYSLLVITQLCGEIAPDIWLSSAPSRAVAVGFDSGDHIWLGTLWPNGFMAATN